MHLLQAVAHCLSFLSDLAVHFQESPREYVLGSSLTKFMVPGAEARSLVRIVEMFLSERQEKMFFVRTEHSSEHCVIPQNRKPTTTQSKAENCY